MASNPRHGSGRPLSSTLGSGSTSMQRRTGIRRLCDELLANGKPPPHPSPADRLVGGQPVLAGPRGAIKVHRRSASLGGALGNVVGPLYEANKSPVKAPAVHLSPVAERAALRRRVGAGEEIDRGPLEEAAEDSGGVQMASETWGGGLAPPTPRLVEGVLAHQVDGTQRSLPSLSFKRLWAEPIGDQHIEVRLVPFDLVTGEMVVPVVDALAFLSVGVAEEVGPVLDTNAR